MKLAAYDRIVINTSAGKDSQAMLDWVVQQARAEGVTDRLVAVHCDLGAVEWPGTRDLAAAQVRHYGLRFEVVRREKGDLLAQVRARGLWPSPQQRYCTSDQKRDQVAKLITRLTAELNKPHAVILQCLGMRAQESPGRAKLEAFCEDTRLSNSRRSVHRWLPIHTWEVQEVWARIKASGVPWHYAYDLGMPRLSCVFCIYAPYEALLLAGKHNPELLDRYVKLEAAIGHDFRKDFKIAQVQADLARGVVPGKVVDWTM